MLGGSDGAGRGWIVASVAVTVLVGIVATASAQGGGQGRATLVFESQPSDGETVEVAWLNSTHGGFVVLHETGFLRGDVFESLRGASDYVEPGPHRNVTARFYEPLERTRDIVTVFHRDTNGNESLDVERTGGAEDGPYQGATGAVFNVAEVRVEQTSESPSQGALASLVAATVAGVAGRAARRH